MDIIDIMLARALTPQGQVETYAAKAQKAAQDAAAAEESAEAAAQTLEDAAQTKSDAESALATVQEALEALDEVANLDLEEVDTEVNKMSFSISGVSTDNNYTQTITATMPDETTSKTITGIGKLYKATGSNQDGGMTQKAITDALAAKADASTAATQQYVQQQIANIPTPSGVSNLGSENSGKMVVVDTDGNITPSEITESALLSAILANEDYTPENVLGLEVDYDNKSFNRLSEAAGKSMGTDFDSYLMYGGRRRCNVADNGTINAFYGESGYTEDGSNGQVMVYQPKFYYKRTPNSTVDNKVGRIVSRDTFMISYTQKNGFKLHPIFINEAGEEVDYVLFSAYEGCLYDTSANSYATTVASDVDFSNDKLSSISGAKPITGSSSLSIQKAEQLANNRGNGWHIYTLAAESANQMLEIVEFGTMNGQTALGKGVSNIVINGNYNKAALTGATSSFGNASGRATSTTIEVNGSTSVYTDDDKTSITYRGVENPWGNVWQMLNGVMIYGNTTSNGGVPYICKNFNYAYNALSSNYESTGFSLPNTSNWISALGYGDPKYDWVLMPAAASNSANSALPIGDNGWFDSNLTGIRMVIQGGGWSFTESDGPFYYGCDKTPSDSSYATYGARLLFLPPKNSIYTANIAKWQTEMNIGG